MRKTLMLSAALFGFAASGVAQPGFAQTTPANTPAAPAAAPSASTPAETMSAKPVKPRAHRAAATHAATSGDIRPGHEPGVGDSFPASEKASNVTAADTRSVIAPRLPSPPGGGNASISSLLSGAQSALSTRKTGLAEESLERAETAMLQRSVPVDQAGSPDQAPDVMQVEAARKALAGGDLAGAKKAVAAAMSAGK